jgi:hypothetical protein
VKTLEVKRVGSLGSESVGLLAVKSELGSIPWLVTPWEDPRALDRTAFQKATQKEKNSEKKSTVERKDNQSVEPMERWWVDQKVGVTVGH